MSKLFAIVHDGTFDGDSSFHCPGEEVPYKEGQSWSEVKKTFLQQRMKEWGGNINDAAEFAEFIEEFGYENAAGAWIVTENQLETIRLVWESYPNRDSETYMCNQIAKLIANKICTKHIGKTPRKDY